MWTTVWESVGIASFFSIMDLFLCIVETAARFRPIGLNRPSLAFKALGQGRSFKLPFFRCSHEIRLLLRFQIRYRSCNAIIVALLRRV